MERRDREVLLDKEDKEEKDDKDDEEVGAEGKAMGESMESKKMEVPDSM